MLQKIPLGSSFEYESNGIIFISYISFYLPKLMVKVFLKARNCQLIWYGGSIKQASCCSVIFTP
jgi:hypothetical protein